MLGHTHPLRPDALVLVQPSGNRWPKPLRPTPRARPSGGRCAWDASSRRDEQSERWSRRVELDHGIAARRQSLGLLRVH